MFIFLLILSFKNNILSVKIIFERIARAILLLYLKTRIAQRNIFKLRSLFLYANSFISNDSSAFFK